MSGNDAVASVALDPRSDKVKKAALFRSVSTRTGLPHIRTVSSNETLARPVRIVQKPRREQEPRGC